MPGAEMFAVWGFLTARSPVAAWCVRMIMNGYEVARSLHRDSVFFAIECWKITLQRAQRNRDYCSLTAEQALTDILLVDNDNDDRRKLKTKAVKIECRTRAPNAYGVGLGLRWLWTVFLCIGHQLHNMKTNKCIGVLTKERKLTLSALGPRTYIIKTEQTDRLVNHCFAVFAVDTASVKRWSTTAGYWSVAYKSTVGYWKLKKAERLSGAMPMPVDIIFFTAITGWPYLAAPGVSVCCQRIALLYSGKFNKSNALNRTEMALK